MKEEPRVEELLGKVLAELRLGEEGGCQLIGPPDFMVTGPADELARIKSGWDSVRYDLAGRLGLLLPEPRYQIAAGFATLCHSGEEFYTFPMFESWIPSTVARLSKEMARFLSFSGTASLLEDLFRRAPCYREEMERTGLSKLLVHQVLQQLLAEQVSIRNLELILTTVLENRHLTEAPDHLVEFVRVALSESICRSLASQRRELRVLTLDPHLEDLIDRRIERTESGNFLVIDPAQGIRLLESLDHHLQRHGQEKSLVLLCAPHVRGVFRKLTQRSFPNLPVISWNEVAPYYEVFSVGVVEYL